MDNPSQQFYQPTQQPSPDLTPSAQTSPAAQPAIIATPTIATEPVQPAAPNPQPTKKKKTPLIIALVVFLLLLVGGGTFATFAIIKHQPDNIAMDAMLNLISAKHVSIDGVADITLDDSISQYTNLKSLSLNFNTKHSGFNHSTDVAISFELADGTTVMLPEIGEMMLDNGTFYLKVDNLKTVYTSYRDMISSYVSSTMESRYRYQLIYECYDTAINRDDYYGCYDIKISSPEDLAAIESMTNMVLGAIDEIVAYMDGKWFAVSLETILNDELLASLGESVRNEILNTYNCVTDKFGNFDQYTDEFATLYNRYPFIAVIPTDNSFYDVSFKPKELAGYINSLPSTSLYNDLSSCAKNQISISNSSYTVSDSDIAKTLEYLPSISAKFDGFLSYHLTELKVTADEDYYNLTSDFKFDYSDDITVSVPTSTIPVMDLVHQIYNKFYDISTSFYSL